jgi:hypothetical protein
MSNKNIIFQINGGIGKCILSTAVCKAVKTKFPNSNLIVLSAYPEVFLNNPHIYRSLQFNAITYFFEDFIDGKDVKLMLHEPYLEIEFLKNRKHLIEVWCNMYDIPYNNELPELYLTKREIDYIQNRYITELPIMVLQTNGGFNENLKYSFARDIPSKIVNEVINTYKNNFSIFHIRKEDQLRYENTTSITANFREILAITLLSKKRLLIDSFLQHATAALNLKSTVCWITNSPNNLGYKLHDNILANEFTKKPELRNSMFQPFDILGNPEQFPYNDESEIFDISKILKSLND